MAQVCLPTSPSLPSPWEMKAFAKKKSNLSDGILRLPVSKVGLALQAGVTQLGSGLRGCKTNSRNLAACYSARHARLTNQIPWMRRPAKWSLKLNFWEEPTTLSVTVVGCGSVDGRQLRRTSNCWTVIGVIEMRPLWQNIAWLAHWSEMPVVSSSLRGCVDGAYEILAT